MIWIRLTDRLGNQMFQYASALGVAERLGTNVVADVSAFATRQSWRRYQLWRFSNIRLGRIVVQGIRTAFRPKHLAVFSASAFGFCPELADVADETLLKGHFQSDRHFSEIRAEVSRLFDLRPFLKRDRHNLVRRRFGARPIVSVHVRRGDYVALKQHNLGDLSDYYRRAANVLLRRQSDAAFAVFSDDPEWCRASPMFNGLDALVLSADTALADMALMASCEHHIIANSTYSWWGAWLGQNPDRQVIFPDRWLSGRSTRAAGVAPQDWTEVAVAG